jgi:gamma-glutamylcyclotransferase (GGCT)/AIG2-like uncharacterized protein YtfP
MKAKDHLFVYGTLRSEARHPMHRVLKRYGEFVGVGRVRGKLYDLGKFPGAVPADGSSLQGQIELTS